jgi:structural maintenance of chromosome 3 (chondroitin sulfate proteoglycan 6)
MTDSERLDLLKEIGGTRVYEERRRESLKIMQDTGKSFLLFYLIFFLCLFSCYRCCYYHVFYCETGNRKKQIIQVIQYLDERLKELDEEKEELEKYQHLDKQRKSLEYAIFNKDVQDAQQKLAKVIYIKMLPHLKLFA